MNKRIDTSKLKEKYPDAYKHFSKWFENYMEEIGWNGLFRATAYDPGNLRVPDFDEVPYEFQNGIIARYEIEIYNTRKGEKGSGRLFYENLFDQEEKRVDHLFNEVQAVHDEMNPTLPITGQGGQA